MFSGAVCHWSGVSGTVVRSPRTCSPNGRAWSKWVGTAMVRSTSRPVNSRIRAKLRVGERMPEVEEEHDQHPQ